MALHNIKEIKIHLALDVCQETLHILSCFSQRLMSLQYLNIQYLDTLLSGGNV